MATYALCVVCGKGTRIFWARQCTYCGDYVCRKHRKNGLCPRHENIMSRENADALLSLDNFHHWFGNFCIPIMSIQLLFSLMVFGGDIITKIIGFACLGAFVVSLVLFILIRKLNLKKTANIKVKVELELAGLKPISCAKCGTTLIDGMENCTNCGAPTGSSPAFGSGSSITSQSISSSSPTYEEYSEYSQPLPPPSPTSANNQQYKPLPPPPPPTNQQQTNYTLPPPPPPPVEESQYRTPPPPPPEDEYTPNKGMNNIFAEIKKQNPDAKIEVTSFYDEGTDSGYHVCNSCGNKFILTGSTTHCPRCNKPIYETR